jgi:peptidoglycan/LPS O-acetylase OafA/YrhL
LWKRFSRIYPAYWVVLALILPVFFFMPTFGHGHERDLDVIIRAIALFPHPETRLVLGVAWTLVYEVFFYLLFALLILNRRIGLLVFATWAACVCCYPWFDGYPWNFLFSYLHLRFLAGMAVAFVLARRELPAPRIIAAIGATIFIGAGMFDAYARPLSALEQTLGYTLGSALALAGLVQAERSGLIRAPGWLVYLGDASYAIYLVHFLALSVLAKLAKAAHLDVHLPGTMLFAMHALGAVGVGCAFHHLVERPLHRWTKQFFRGKRPAVAAESGTDELLRRAA